MRTHEIALLTNQNAECIAVVRGTSSRIDRRAANVALSELQWYSKWRNPPMLK
jgi:hypothetical protein